MLIAFTGHLGSGKDTASAYLIEKYGYKQHTFAAPLKKALEVLFLFNEHQLYGTQEEKQAVDERWGISPRTALQWLGTDVLRNQLDADYFLKHFELSYHSISSDKVVVSDLRFKNEAALIKKLGGVILKLNRNSSSTLSTSSISTTSLSTSTVTSYHTHQSETELNDITYDYVIDNNNTVKDLYKQIDDIILQLL